jgi:SAM-dependent methyltransferase
MSGSAFGQAYAEIYDRLYSDKDYARECDLLEELFRRCSGREIQSILDLGCGTGGHAFPLADRGYQVLGVERSADMIAQASRKRAALDQAAGELAPTFQQGDLQTLDLGRRFDAALMMFAVLGYQTSNAEVSGALAAARRHLDPGALLVFDVWYGPAVLAQRPEERLKALESPQGRVQRTATPELDVRRHLCRVHYRLRREGAGGQPMESAEEHIVRYFFPAEIEQFLTGCRFELAHLSDFSDLNAEPTLDTWNVLACARAV